MYVRWMLVALVGVLSTTLVMRGEAASPDVAFPLYKHLRCPGPGGDDPPRTRRSATSRMSSSTRPPATSCIVS